MHVSQIIKPSALSIRVTEVTEGSVYKRLDKPSYGDERMVFGVVTDVLHDGENAAIVAIEFSQGWSGGDITPRIKTFSKDTEVLLFPATPDEFAIGMAEALAQQRTTVETAERDLAAKKAVFDRMVLVSQTAITAPRTEAITA